MRADHRTWWAIATAALVATACGETTAPPQLSNPQQLNSDLQTVSGVFQTSVFQSFAAIGTAPGSPAASAVPAGALLRATSRAAPTAETQPYAEGPARLQALRVAASTLSAAGAAAVIPPALLGKTFVWDATTHQYVVGPDPGPTNGVRIILYQVDATGQVIEPTVAVGSVDLLDESAGSTNQLHVIVQSGTPASPGVTFANYTISATVTTDATGQVTAFSATASGFVSDGTRRLDFTTSFSATNLNTDNPDAQVDATWSLSSPAVSVELHEAIATPDANNATFTINLRVTRGAETVVLSGTITVVVSPVTVTADLTVTVNGAVFARITGTNNGIQARHPDGSQLSQDELQALQRLFELPDDINGAIEHLFNPAEHLLGA